MNLRRPNASGATGTFNRSKNIAPVSGLCSTCLDGCTGNCEAFVSSFRGPEALYPGPYGQVTAGAEKNYPVDYSHLNIQGYATGARGLPTGWEAGPDTATFPTANTEVEYGWGRKVRMHLPIFTGALGSTEIARRNWEHLAVGAAISGITLVCGENVCGMDPDLELDQHGKVKRSPEMDRRIETYKRFHDGLGELLIQMNVEDERLGVAEYVLEKHHLDTIELKWGQGAKSIGGEVKVDRLETAVTLKERGYLVLPNPTLGKVQEAYRNGAFKEFERHSRLGFAERESFLKGVERLRELGFRRVTLKTGGYSAQDLAMALRLGAEAQLDLITLDGASGGTGMSPWPMMNEWGIPTFYLESLAYQFCERLSKRGVRVPDLAIAGGFSTEDGVFKAIAMGSPYVKAVCMGRALIIPGMVGKNIGEWLEQGKLPRTVSKYGTRPEQIFACYHELRERYGNEMRQISLGAVGVYSFCQKIKRGLQQLMAGSRNFQIATVSREDLMALTEEAARVSGIPYVMDACMERAVQILEQ